MMLSTRVPKRVVVAFPRVENAVQWNEILAVRDRFDPLAGLIAPHLTLVFPFEDAMSDRSLGQHVRAAISEVPAFALTLREVTAHENEYLFLNVKRGNDELILLHDVLHANALAAHRGRAQTFIPHVTVGRVPPQDLAAALDATSGLTSAIPARVDSVAVYRIEPDGARPVLFKLPLRAPDR